ncbi:hypothetical protein MKEN_00388700 [Mycena kentingensis (nom. inval.)]|nr:hypothetical protein MKEN_00388700 [Mycena kentingensis (nom. inval.)]
MLRLASSLVALALVPLSATSPTPQQQWKLTRQGESGVVALETIFVSDTLALFMDKATNDPVNTTDGRPAWANLWNVFTHEITPLKLVDDSFCASGSFLSNGTMVSVGGMIPYDVEINQTHAEDGRMGIRIFEPCTDPDGVGCTIFEDLENIHLAETRWYVSSLRIFDGSLMIVGGMHESTPFYNTDPVNSFEFSPPKDGGVPRFSPFLERTGPVNLFPRAIALPDGKVFMAANNQSMIYDIETDTELRLPDIPNGVRITNPQDGTITLLPLSPPHYIPEILICGGNNASDTAPTESLSAFDPAASQCSRMALSPAGIAKGWEVEHMPEGRIMPDMVLLPDGRVVIVNGGASGYAAFDAIGTMFGISHAPRHQRFVRMMLRRYPSTQSTIHTVSLIDLGFATHAFHSSTVLVFMEFTLSHDHKSLNIVSPPNNRVYPPGPAYIFVTVGGTWSVGARVMVGTGESPPVQDQV